MALASGTRIGPYEVTAQIGVGGMGEVYRATDTKLKRQVAIKVLPATVAGDSERLARFQREAEVLAALNHPNIAAIYGLEDADSTKALVMELVEGPTLADRIAQGAIPVEEALPIAKQVAEALEAAHEQGIIHRDLKPANIKVRHDGMVKVLDFGLAKAMEPAGSSPNVSQAPTITTPAMTQVGMILGTAAYMSPEQARGKIVDKRADIWAFGAVLFEMLTGGRAFAGEDVGQTLARVVEREPDFDALPAAIPSRVAQVLRLCLRKDAKQRVADIRDVRLALEGAFETSVPQAAGVVPTRARGSRVAWVAGAVGLMAAGALVAYRFASPDVPAPPMVSFEVRADGRGGGQAPYHFALSPDGGSLVARVSAPGGPDRLWVRRLDRLGGTLLEGTENATWPCWSPDGRSVAFGFGLGKIFVTEVSGGSPQPLADAEVLRGCSWNAQGTILFSSNRVLFRVDASGGSPTPVTSIDAARGDDWHLSPVFLPDGAHFLFHVIAASPEQSGIYVGSLDSKDVKRVGPSSIAPRFAPPDLLFFGRDNALMAQRFDTTRMELVGTPVRVAGNLGRMPEQAGAGVSVSSNGTIAYRPGRPRGLTLQWRDRDGNVTGTVGTGAYRNPRLSPDGTRLAVAREDGDKDIWITDLARDAATRLTFDPASDDAPVWSPDGSRVAFSSSRIGGVYNLFQRSANGTGADELLLQTPNSKIVNDWSADGQYLIYQEQDPTTKSDIWALPLFGDRKPLRLVGTPAVERSAALSPDGRWLAYESNEGGAGQVYVQGFPTAGGRWQVSTTRGAMPRWGSATEIFYDGGGQLMAVEVIPAKEGEFKAGPPRVLFGGLLAIYPHNMDVTRDGRRFLTLGREPDPDGADPIVVILNWRSELEQ